MEKRLSYFYWWCHWDFEKVVAALAQHYEIPYVTGDKVALQKIVTTAYSRYYGLHELNPDIHGASIKGSLQDLEAVLVVPECIMREAYEHAHVKRTPGFYLGDLMAPPPYKSDWEKPPQVQKGVLKEPAYAS